MKMIATTVIFGCMVIAAAGVSAQDTMKKDSPAAMDGAMTKPMTLQECKDHMAMAKKDGKKDAATVKKEAACTEMMKKPPADEAKKQ